MTSRNPDELRKKVDTFLRDALDTPDPKDRSKLLGKAVHWTNVAKAQSSPRPRLFDDRA